MNDRPSNHTSAQHSCSPRTVLLVDEQCGELGCLVETLREHGCEVYSCTRYEEGLRQLESRFFDFVVVCQGGPQFKGKPIVQRAIEIDRRTPILVVTGCLDMQCYLEAMQLGALDYLERPLVPEEIARLVETHSRPRAAGAAV
jgi:two-component system, NtrC family, C4-dicarboxylate transport response regulator DctD